MGWRRCGDAVSRVCVTVTAGLPRGRAATPAAHGDWGHLGHAYAGTDDAADISTWGRGAEDTGKRGLGTPVPCRGHRGAGNTREGAHGLGSLPPPPPRAPLPLLPGAVPQLRSVRAACGHPAAPWRKPEVARRGRAEGAGPPRAEGARAGVVFPAVPTCPPCCAVLRCAPSS